MIETNADEEETDYQIQTKDIDKVSNLKPFLIQNTIMSPPDTVKKLGIS